MSRLSPKDRNGFTIIELLIVMAIIIVLAGLILATSGYVQDKGKRSRAEAEIAAMSAALESYKADNGVYPQNEATNSLDPDTTLSSAYLTASGLLYRELSGDKNADGQVTTADADPSPKSYMSFKPAMMHRDNMSAGVSSGNPVTAVRDAFGFPYGYSTAKASGGTSGYNPTFDLWSTAGRKKDSETDEEYRRRWIKNW